MKTKIAIFAIFMLTSMGIWSVSTLKVEANNIVSPLKKHNLTTITIGDQDFTLVNKTGIEIYSVYVSPSNSDDWGEDVLGQDTLDDGDSVDIHFSRKEKAKLWDLRVEDSEGNYVYWEDFDLLEISKITIYYKKGKATAETE
jgi:hypothetical protein